METVAQSLGKLDGKIIIDISMPSEQGEDGYFVPMVTTSSAEMVQSWNPAARVVKAFATQGSFVVDNPNAVGGPATVPIPSNDREAKEVVARMAAEMGLDPVDAGPLRTAREIEALQRLYMVPLLQRRSAGWEPYFRRSYYWECIWQDDWYKRLWTRGVLPRVRRPKARRALARARKTAMAAGSIIYHYCLPVDTHHAEHREDQRCIASRHGRLGP
jgi:hypothetical protein